MRVDALLILFRRQMGRLQIHQEAVVLTLQTVVAAARQHALAVTNVVPGVRVVSAAAMTAMTRQIRHRNLSRGLSTT